MRARFESDKNTLHVIADDMADARAQFIEATERDRTDRGLTDATERAVEAVRGLVNNGPVSTVNAEFARLVREAKLVARKAEKWGRIAERLDQQRTTHRAEDKQSTETIRAAETRAAQVRAKAVAELVPQAVEDGAAYLTAVSNESAASDRMATAGRFARRRARHEHQAATGRTRTAHKQVRDTWGTSPRHADTLTEWAVTAAEHLAEDNPRVTDATCDLAAALTEQATLKHQHARERLALLAHELGAERVRRDPIQARFIRPDREARNTHAQATEARHKAEELRALLPKEAAAWIEAMRVAAEQAQQLADERGRRLRGTLDRASAQTKPRRDGPGLGL